MHALALAGLLLAPPPDALACPDPALRLGPAAAPQQIEAFVDPVADTTLRSLLELERLVAERPGTLQVTLRWLSPADFENPVERRVRVWTTAMARLDALEPALRLLAREGVDRVNVRLGSPSDRAELARELGIPVDEHEAHWNDPCAATELRHAQRRALRHLEGRGATSFRVPLYVVDAYTFEDGPSLDTLRPTLGRLAHARRREALRPPPPPPEPRAASDRLRRPPLKGVLLGGVGLPHRFLTMARDEEDPNLFMLLPPVLAYAERHPGQVAIAVVARGSSINAERLRRRLCAARELGLEAPYVALLASDPATRRADPAVRALLERLDGVSEDDCRGEPDPSDLGLPDGGWLDGIPRTRTELENLAATLRLLDTAARPLDPWLGPRQGDL